MHLLFPAWLSLVTLAVHGITKMNGQSAGIYYSCTIFIDNLLTAKIIA